MLLQCYMFKTMYASQNSLDTCMPLLGNITLIQLRTSRYTFASGSPDNIKQWKFPDGNFLQNLSGHNAIINSLALNSDNVLVSAGKSPYFIRQELFLCTLVPPWPPPSPHLLSHLFACCTWPLLGKATVTCHSFQQYAFIPTQVFLWFLFLHLSFILQLFPIWLTLSNMSLVL